MQIVFLRMLNMSLTACWVIAAVLLARALLRKAPRRCTYWLWAVVLFRLACPFSFESALSLVPSAQPVQAEIARRLVPQVSAGLPAVDAAVNTALPAAQVAAADPARLWLAVGAAVWLAGLAALLVYTLVTVLRLAASLRLAQPLPQPDGSTNVYLLRRTRSPFVFGLVRPRIYLPARLTPEETDLILAHERTHLRRGDHWVKPLAWLLVCVHWFNPLVWVSFFLLEKDMELSCDELVVRRYTAEQKREYSRTLLRLSAAHRFVGGCPVAFGESNIKERIRSIMKLKKTPIAVSLLAAAVVAAVCFGCAANPKPAGGQASSSQASSSQGASSQAASSQAASSEGASSQAAPDDEVLSYAGRGLTFAVPGGWTVELVQTEDILLHNFYSADGAQVMTYHFGEAWVTGWPLDEATAKSWYQDGGGELRLLENVTIAGAPGKKLVLDYPAEDYRVEILYITMLPDALVMQNGDGDTVSLPLAEQFVFTCTAAEREQTEAMADQIIASAQYEPYTA